MAKKPKVEKKDEWVAVNREKCRELAVMAVHYSFKTVNSNAPQGGIRLSVERALSIPYLCGRSALSGGISVDYQGNAANSGIFKQIAWVKEDNENCDIPAEDAAFIRSEILPLMEGDAEFNTDCLDARMVQILLPRNGSYVSITPITAAGFAEKINAAVSGHNDLAKTEKENVRADKLTLRRIAQGFIGIGGIKSLNVGRLAGEMTTPIYFDAPKEQLGLKRAFAIYHKGIDIKIPAHLINEYVEMRSGWLKVGMNERYQESGIFVRMAEAVLSEAKKATDILNLYAEKTGGGLSENVDPIIAELLFPESRSKSWTCDFSMRVAITIASHASKSGSDRISSFPSFGDAEIISIAQQIEKGIR